MAVKPKLQNGTCGYLTPTNSHSADVLCAHTVLQIVMSILRLPFLRYPAHQVSHATSSPPSRSELHTRITFPHSLLPAQGLHTATPIHSVALPTSDRHDRIFLSSCQPYSTCKQRATQPLTSELGSRDLYLNGSLLYGNTTMECIAYPCCAAGVSRRLVLRGS